MKDYAEGKVSSDCCVGEMHRHRLQKMTLGEYDLVVAQEVEHAS